MMTTTNSIANDIDKLSNRDLISAKNTIEKEIETLKVMENELNSSLTSELTSLS